MSFSGRLFVHETLATEFDEKRLPAHKGTPDPIRLVTKQFIAGTIWPIAVRPDIVVENQPGAWQHPAEPKLAVLLDAIVVMVTVNVNYRDLSRISDTLAHRG